MSEAAIEDAEKKFVVYAGIMIPAEAVEGGRGHWSEYYPGTGWGYRYRHCRVCNQVWRNNGEKPLIRKGGK